MLAEVCIVIAGMAVFLNLCPPMVQKMDSSYFTFSAGYLHTQSIALTNSTREEYTSENGESVTFNESGNVASPRTVQFEHHEIVVELGGGRLVEHR